MSPPARRMRWVAAVAGLIALAVPVCWTPASPPTGAARLAIPARSRPAAPRTALRVDSTTALRATLARASTGSAIVLAPGVYDGPVEIERSVTLWGPPEAVIRSRGRGSTVLVHADDVALLGFTVDGSGGRFDLLDAAVRVERSRRVRIEGVAVRRALFGILIERSAEVLVRGCRVEGTGNRALGLRGDGIRLWEVRDSRIEDNHVFDSRDLVVWYSPHNRIAGNRVERGRYGTHFMYSHHNTVEDNTYLDNVVGTFVMYSRDIALRRNLFARSGGAAGVGLGVKESGALTVTDNRFLANTTGIYLDTSPLDLANENRFLRNAIRFSDTGLVFHGRAAGNRYEDNLWSDNSTPVRVEGGGDALRAAWSGNRWDDYRGYDLDGDGFGDVPYELRSLSGELTAKHPELRLLAGTPALALIDVAAHAMPLLQPRLILRDPHPRMGLDDPVREERRGED